MAMTEQEIATAAARRSSAMRRRTTKPCAVCGNAFEGVAQRRYCSDRCRVGAARRRAEDAAAPPPAAPSVWDANPAAYPGHVPLDQLDDDWPVRGADEPIDEFLQRVAERLSGGRTSDTDSVELVRQSREQRTEELMRALGW